MPEMDRPVSVASWMVVVAARPEKPWSWTVRRGSKSWSDSCDIRYALETSATRPVYVAAGCWNVVLRGRLASIEIGRSVMSLLGTLAVILATLCGPVFAVQVQKYLERRRPPTNVVWRYFEP